MREYFTPRPHSREPRIQSRRTCSPPCRPLYKKYSYGTTLYSPLARGLLTGKVRPDSLFANPLPSLPAPPPNDVPGSLRTSIRG